MIPLNDVLLFPEQQRLCCRSVIFHPAYSPDSQVSPHTHLHEPLEGSRLHFPTHDHHHLVSEFDVWLPAKVAARGAFKHEAKVWKHRPWPDGWSHEYKSTSRFFLFLRSTKAARDVPGRSHTYLLRLLPNNVWMNPSAEKFWAIFQGDPYAPMWMRWPWLSNMMFPLCLSLICSRKSTKL